MRRLLGALVLVLACPVWAMAATEVSGLVDDAIQALKTKSYDGRLRFLSQADGGEERTVQISHVAPELYRVVPLFNGVPSSAVYIENSVELVRLSGKDNLVHLPARQYYVTDMMTASFLRDLGTHAGTSLLDGEYNGVPVYFLRQDVTREKPYLVTVGLRRDNKFPMFLQVVDAQGRTRVHFEFEAIKFLPASGLKDELFTIPEDRDERRQPSSHIAKLRAPAAAEAQAPAGSSKSAAKASGRNASGPKDEAHSAAVAAPAAQLPLYPEWLPQGYNLEAISVLDYNRGRSGPALVYQFEIYGPQVEQMISVFQMHTTDLSDYDLTQALGPNDGGYLLQQQDGWVVAVFGGLPRAELQRVIDSLDSAHHDTIKQLLSQTRLRDQMLQQATDR